MATPAGVGVVVVRGRGVGGQVALGEHGADGRGEPGVGDLVDEKLEEPGELLGVATGRGSERRRIDVGRLERPHVELEPVAEALDAAEHADGVAFAEAPVEQLDVVPDARGDAAARIDELEGEIRRAVLRPHGVDALDDPVLRKLRDRHRSSLSPGPDAEALFVASVDRLLR